MSEIAPAPQLQAKRLGLMTQDEAIVLMRADCHVCRAEGLSARARVLIRANGGETIATLYQVVGDWLGIHEAALSEAAWRRLGVNDGDVLHIEHAPTLESLADVRRRLYGRRLNEAGFRAIIADVASGRYGDIHLATFLAACSAFPLDLDEMTHLTRAMVEAGDTLAWQAPVVIDKHCVGGLPGNRTTPIVVAICASLGLIMPKTSSRAITSPAGTADTMETLAPVDLDVSAMRRVVEQEGGCIVWGGSVRLSPADDVLIRVERALDMDAEGQLIASVLSKKIAAGSTHVILDLPVGPTAKVRTAEAANTLAAHLVEIAARFGLKARAIVTDGAQPVGRAIGPALEAVDVLAVLQNTADAPADLRERALKLAGAAIELAGGAPDGAGEALARETLASGRAWSKFERICAAQGGMRTPPRARLRRDWCAKHAGVAASIDNRKIARLAKLAGAPDAKAAGLELHVRVGSPVKAGDPLFTIHAEAEGELRYALDYADANSDMVVLEG
ncbi:MAG TPA: thymidine phosphorylase family protein [Caulobacterales bacterium]|nr:thymidine phosphorylase family protein [Caulobacterales bacterium]